MASTYLSRTASAGNQKTFTISVWLKRSQINTSTYNTFFSSDVSGSNSFRFTFNDDDGSTDDKLMVYYYTGSHQLKLITNRQFRDTSAWYHIVLAVDTTQATSSDRVKIYVNGVQETSFSTATYPSQNLDTSVNANSAPHEIGRGGGSLYYDGSMSHFHFIDGTAYDASAFGETDATTGIWKPKTAPSVTYGTNGFFLKFENSGAFGTDSSVNANNFTVNGTMTQTIDTPSNVFATINPLDNFYNASTFTNGNNTITTGSTNVSWNTSTLGVSSGKWYWETELDAESGGGSALFGISDRPAVNSTEELGGLATTYAYLSSGQFRTNNTNTANGVSTTVGNIIGIALNLDDNQISYYKNGTIIGSAQSITAPSSTSTGVYFPAWGDWLDPGTVTFKCNFGNGYFGTTAVSSAENPDDGIGIFEYAVPTGYKALCTKSINAQEYD